MSIKKFSMYVMVSLLALTLQLSAAMTISDVTEATAEERKFVTNALNRGNYLVVQRNGNSVTLTESREPGVGGLVKALQFVYEIKLTASILHEKSDSPSLLETAAYVGSLIMEQQAKAAVDENNVKTVVLLYDLLKNNPGDGSLVRTADMYSAEVNQLRGKSSQLVSSNDRLSRAVRSARLGIPVPVFEKYPDLLRFIEANEIDQKMVYFGQKVQLKKEGDDQVPYLLVEGEYVAWPELKSSLELDTKGQLTDHIYTFKGLVPGSADSMIPVFNTEKTQKYGDRYTVTLLGYKPNSVPHLWVQLRNPEGEMISVGWMSTGSEYSSYWYFFSPDIHNGKILSPDPMEVASRGKAGLVEVPIEISGAEYHDLIDLLTKYQQNPDACYSKEAQGTGGTADCGGFVLTVLENIGMDVSAMPHDIYDLNGWLKRVAKKRQDLGSSLTEPYGLPTPAGEVR